MNLRQFGSTHNPCIKELLLRNRSASRLHFSLVSHFISKMSASSIPNLLSLRGGRGGRGGGLRARRGGGPGGAGAHHDSTIQGTDTDAAVSRLSAVDVGYLDDPYAVFLVSRMDGPPQRRFPIINRGMCRGYCKVGTRRRI